MFLRKYWIPISVFLVAIVGIGLYLLATQPPKDPIVIYKPVEPEKPTEQPKAEAVEGDTSQDGHIHADGTWHEGPHAEVDRPVLPPLQAQAEPQEIPKFVKPVSDAQDVTIADRVRASGDVPDRAELEAMSDEQLTQLMDESYEKTRELSPEMYDKMREWAKAVGDLTRHAKTREENDAILEEHADTVQPLADAMNDLRYEHAFHQLVGNRAFKILSARFYIANPDFVVQESLTDEFWASFWSDF